MRRQYEPGLRSLRQLIEMKNSFAPGMLPKSMEAVSYSFVYSVLFYAAPLSDMPRQKFFLFSSLAAIFEIFSPEQIGCGLGHLYNLKVPDGSSFAGKRCIIKREKVFSKRQKPR